MSPPPPARDEQKERSWLTRLRQFIVRRKTADTIIGDVGQDARNVTIGKNIIQIAIGRLAIPFWPLILLFILLSLWIVYQYQRNRGPTMMSGEFNIAIAEFGLMDSAGNVESSETGQDMSRWLFDRLSREYASLSLPIIVELWHDSMNLDVKLGPISGQDPAARQEAAAALAQKIKADVIVYGNLTNKAGSDQFVPEFYVRSLPDAAELVGAYQLGSPIAITQSGQALAQTLQVNPKLQARVTALVSFTVGITWEFLGEPSKALRQFREVEQLEAWQDGEGREILYLFIGREAYLLWRAGEPRADEVSAAFNRALDINSEYGRAYIGLGNFYREQAERRMADIQGFIDTEGLASTALQEEVAAFEQEIEQAVTTYNQALEVAPRSQDGQVAVKGHLALGGVHNLQGRLYELLQQTSRAQSFLELAFGENEMALAIAAPDDHRHQALAYYGMGLAHYREAELRSRRADLAVDDVQTQALFAEAHAAFNQCILIAENDLFDWFLQELKEQQCIEMATQSQQMLTTVQGVKES